MDVATLTNSVKEEILELKPEYQQEETVQNLGEACCKKKDLQVQHPWSKINLEDQTGKEGQHSQSFLNQQRREEQEMLQEVMPDHMGPQRL